MRDNVRIFLPLLLYGTAVLLLLCLRYFVAPQSKRKRGIHAHGADRCATIAVAHVILHTDRMDASARFARAIGARPVFEGPKVSVYEMRGGTHLLLMLQNTVVAGAAAPFDLMVDDLHATHERFASLGFAPSPIVARPAIDHEVFTVREPAGHVITFFSSHSSRSPI